jgi:hypothetical protein
MVFVPTGTNLAELAGVAGLRWTIEECFQRAKEELGLDHCGQAASDRLTDPGMAGTPHDAVHAGACLPDPPVGCVAPCRGQQSERKESGKLGRLTWLLSGLPSVPEIRHIMARLFLKTVPDVHSVLAWSRWRRHHQAEAATAHYRNREDQTQL